jgi:hypothetical protein
MEYKISLKRTLGDSCIQLQNFWYRDVKTKRCMYTVSSNLEELREEYYASFNSVEQCIVFPNAEEYMRFMMEWG